MFTIAAESKEAVDSWRKKVVDAGGTVFSEPADMKLGYNFGFADPEGHRWNVFYENAK